jgi:hypothetical protein
MKRMLACVALWAMVLLFPGCATTPDQGMIMTGFQSIKPNESPPPADVFGPGEVPSAYVYGYDNQPVTIDIYDISTGTLMKRQTSFVPKGKDYYWVLPVLPPGSYKAILSMGGTAQETKLFSIRR